MFLKELTEIDGASGDESRVREFIEEKISKVVDKIWTDKMGNLIAFRRGKKSGFKLLLAAHMDEVAFMVTNINEDGTLSFAPVGGVDPKVVIGKVLRVGDKLGVVGYKPIHLQREKPEVEKLSFKELFIDIGARKKEEVEIELGSYAYFTTEYEEVSGKALGKAFDDRVGCSLLIKLIHESKPLFDTYFAFLVQEEVGLRGSATVLEQMEVDSAVVVEGTTAGDIETNEEDRWATHLGEGPAITFMHRGLVVNEGVFRAILETAKKLGIPHQYKMRTAGGTDAYRLSTTAYGVPSGVVSVPSRYIHSPVSVIDLNDYENTFKLLKALVESDVMRKGVLD